MKHIYVLFLLLTTFAIVGTGCSEEDYASEESKSDLELVRSNLKFGPGEASDTIYFNCTRPVKVETEAGWCSVKTEDSKAIVTVKASSLPDSRSGIITVSDGYKTLRVPVYQSGNYMSVAAETYVTGFKADTTTISIRANMDYKVQIPSEAASWLKAEKSKNSCTFYIDKYDGKATRKATVTFSSGKNVYKMTITQIDVRGAYTATFSDYDENNELVNYKGTFELTEDGLDVGGLVIPITLDSKTGLITIAGGQYIGAYKAYYLYTSISSEEGYVTWNDAVAYTGELTLGKDNAPSYTFGDNGSWTGYTINGFTIDAYSQKTAEPVKANRLGSMLNFIGLEMVKDAPASTPVTLSRMNFSRSSTLVRNWQSRVSKPKQLWKVRAD